ncbi:hypothetical protein DXG01_015799 [Tephrocybe rancida]|nr:hypothetical protein DXG01_015799 [Tephrocybe rancida]
MFNTSSLLAGTLMFALAVSANPVVVHELPVKLTLSRHVNLRNLISRDLARVKYLRARGRALAQGHAAPIFVNEPIDNQAVYYIASIGVGCPPTTYNVIVDTGSSNTWIGAGTPYNVTGTSVKTSNNVSVTYGSGSFRGTEYTDTVALTPDFIIPQQSIGIASESRGFDGVDGILGPAILTRGTLSPDKIAQVPTLTDNAFSRGLIAADEIGIYFQPTTVLEALNGELTWGGVDPTKYIGDITYANVTPTSPAKYYWGINQSISFNQSTTLLASTAGIVDTGTTLVYIASDAYQRYCTATGAVYDSNVGLLRITKAQLDALPSLFFTINGVTFEFTANAQLWPRSLNTAIGGLADSIYLIVANIGMPTGSGLDFINGYAFLERFYTVYDTTNKRVGFATTPFTNATTN